MLTVTLNTITYTMTALIESHIPHRFGGLVPAVVVDGNITRATLSHADSFRVWSAWDKALQRSVRRSELLDEH